MMVITFINYTKSIRESIVIISIVQLMSVNVSNFNHT